MSKFLRFILLTILLLGLAGNVCALVKVKAKGEVETKKKNPGVKLVKEAIRSGQEQALKKWSVGLDSQRLQIINELWTEIVNDLDTYVMETSQLNDGEWANGKWMINLEVTINDAQIEQLINQRSQTSRQNQVETYLSFIYVAREVSTIQISADTVQSNVSSTNSNQRIVDNKSQSNISTDTQGNLNVSVRESGRSEKNTQVDLKAEANVTADHSRDSYSSSSSSTSNRGNTQRNAKSSNFDSSHSSRLSSEGHLESDVEQAYSSRSDTNVMTDGTSTQSRSEESILNISHSREQLSDYRSSGYVVKSSEGISYRVFNPQEIDTKVTEIFNKSGFDVVPCYEVDIAPEFLAYDFATLNEISSSTQKEATELARDAGLDFLAIGMLDLGREEIDPVTGYYKIYAKVNGYIMDLRKKFAVKICSVGPVQYCGWGENPSVAKTNALIEASQKASVDLVDQLRVKLGM
ncbi:MAG: hypothetical protein GXY81_00700 [Candidatus Cloacimonetes bacterium]|nr:hypothetical protein [Candidatus Cloacimonadota bacterium]